MKRVYLAFAVVGTVVPWLFFASFFARHGIDPPAFLGGLFVNGAAGGFTADVLISILVFWLWSYLDAAREGVRHWWWVLPAGCLVGLSLALPLYLYLREDRRSGAVSSRSGLNRSILRSKLLLPNRR